MHFTIFSTERGSKWLAALVAKLGWSCLPNLEVSLHAHLFLTDSKQLYFLIGSLHSKTPTNQLACWEKYSDSLYFCVISKQFVFVWRPSVHVLKNTYLSINRYMHKWDTVPYNLSFNDALQKAYLSIKRAAVLAGWFTYRIIALKPFTRSSGKLAWANFQALLYGNHFFNC